MGCVFDMEQGGMTALMFAARRGHAAVVEHLLGMAADVNLQRNVRCFFSFGCYHACLTPCGRDGLQWHGLYVGHGTVWKDRTDVCC